MFFLFIHPPLKQVTPYIFFSQCIFLPVVPCSVSNCSRCFRPVLLQHGAEPSVRNTDGRTALDLAEASAKAVLTGESISHASLKPVLLKQSFPKSVDFSHVTQTNPLAFFFPSHTGEYRKDELLESARYRRLGSKASYELLAINTPECQEDSLL